jgi:hypothetical protein
MMAIMMVMGGEQMTNHLTSATEGGDTIDEDASAGAAFLHFGITR